MADEDQTPKTVSINLATIGWLTFDNVSLLSVVA